MWDKLDTLQLYEDIIQFLRTKHPCIFLIEVLKKHLDRISAFLEKIYDQKTLNFTFSLSEYGIPILSNASTG